MHCHPSFAVFSKSNAGYTTLLLIVVPLEDCNRMTGVFEYDPAHEARYRPTNLRYINILYSIIIE